MNAKHTWAWVVVAAALFAFIFFFERHWRQPAPGSGLIFPNFKAAGVTSVQVRPAGQSEIRAERTNAMWFLTKPITYPAKAASIEALLNTLEHLTPAAPPLTARELRLRPNAEVEYGFENPQATLLLQPGHLHVFFGALTSPGDQVFLRVVGVEDVYVVDAGLLKLIPRATNDWRDTTFVDLRKLNFDRLIITNAARLIELQRDLTNLTWRMTRPMPSAADQARMVESLQKLQLLSVTQFVSDSPGEDLEKLGLQPAELELTLANGTNPVARLLFGKTNNAGQVYAKRSAWPAIVTVPNDSIEPWRAPFNDFRDRRLVTLPSPRGPVEVLGEDQFTLLPQTNGWVISPQDFPVDGGLVDDFLTNLAALEVAQFVKDAITEPDLRAYGLTSPVRQIVLKLPSSGTNATTNQVFAHWSFGSTNGDLIYTTRLGGDSVYAVKLADFQRLPSASWQLRERRIWRFTESDVARLMIRQAGKTREIVRNGTNSWTLAPGSQGVINVFGIEETVHRFGGLEAASWAERGLKDRSRYGLTANNYSLTFELKSGEKLAIEFGGVLPSGYPYAAVTLGKEIWVFEFPLALYQLVSSYLRIPPDVP